MLIYPNVRIFSIKLPTFLVVKRGKKISEIGLFSYWVIFEVYLPLFSYRNRLPSVSCFSFIVFGSWRLENICFSHFWKSGLCKGMWEFSSLNGEFRKSLIHKWVRLLGLNSLDLCKRKTLGTLLLTALADVSAEIKSRCSLLVNENYICMTLEVKKKHFWDAKLTQQIHKGQRIFSGNLAALTHQSDSKQQDKQDEIGCHFQAQMTWSI